MAAVYEAYSTTDFLDDTSFIRWVKGDAAAAATWEAWLATGPPNAAAALTARQQLRLLLAAEPVAVGAHTLRFIWHDINHSIAERAAQRRRTWQWAAALAGVGLGGWLLLHPAAPTAPAVLTEATAYGQTRQLTLPDGTLVTLNAHSLLRRRAWAPGGVREVWLQGEAYFDVKHLDTNGIIVPSERFVVHTGRLDVEVLGTRFNVKQRRAHTQVVLQSGRVRVSLPGQATAAVVLAPREAARFDSVSGHLDKLAAASTAPALAWTAQKLLLHHTTVQDVLHTVEDTYGYRTVLADPRLGQRELEGELPLHDEKSVLFVLSAILHVPVTRHDSTIYIGRAAR